MWIQCLFTQEKWPFSKTRTPLLAREQIGNVHSPIEATKKNGGRTLTSLNCIRDAFFCVAIDIHYVCCSRNERKKFWITMNLFARLRSHHVLFMLIDCFFSWFCVLCGPLEPKWFDMNFDQNMVWISKHKLYSDNIFETFFHFTGIKIGKLQCLFPQREHFHTKNGKQ